MDDESINEYVALGRQNAEILELARNWCSHLEVDRAGGVGMLEEMTGLPIGMRMFICKHQRGNSIGAMDLRHVALSFYDENCVGCPHRNAVRLPNLTQIVTERDRAREAAEARAAEERDRAAAALAARDAARQTARDKAAPSTQGIIDLVGELDATWTEEAHAKLAALAQTVPDAFTGDVRALLVDLARVGGEGRTRTALEVLDAIDVSGKDLAHLAFEALARHEASEIAESIVARHAGPEHREAAKTAFSAIFVAASPVREPFHRDVQPRTAALLRVYALFRDDTESALRAFIRSDNERARVIAAGVWTVLMTADSAIAVRLAPDAIASLELPGGEFGEVDGARRATSHALGRALAVQTNEVDALLQAAHARGTARPAILDACADTYGLGFGYRKETPAPIEARRCALQRIIEALLNPATKPDELRMILAFVREEAPRDADFLVASAEVLLGALALLIARMEDVSAEASPLLIPNADPVVLLERQSQRTLLDGIMNSLSSLLGAALEHDRERVLPLLIDLLDNTETTPNLRAHLVRMVGDAAKDRTALGSIVPIIYSALTHGAQQVRAAGVRAFGAIAKHGVDDLPPLMTDVVLALLTDPYVVVHRAVARILTDITLPEPQRKTAAATLAYLVEVYARAKTDDRATRSLIDAFLSQWTGALPPTTVTRLLDITSAMAPDEGAQTLLDLEHVVPSDAWMPAAARCASTPALSEYRRSDLLERIFARHSADIALHAEALRTAVLLRVEEMGWPRNFGDDDYLDTFVERLQQLEAWGAAGATLAAAEALFTKTTRTRGRAARTVSARRALNVENAPDLATRGARAQAWVTDEHDAKLDAAAAIRARFGAVLALIEGDSVRIAEAATAIAHTADDIDDESIRDDYKAFGHILLALTHLFRWHDAMRAAEPDADRFRKAAVIAARDAERNTSFGGTAKKIIAITDGDSIDDLARVAASVRVPVPLARDAYRRIPRPTSPVDVRAPVPAAVAPVAFVRFSIAGKEVPDPLVVTPRVLQDLTIEITLSAWPEDADRLVIDALSTVPAASYDMPVFTLDRPTGDAPHRWTIQGPFIIRDAQSLETGPLEFRYRASAEGGSGVRSIALEGQRMLHFFAYEPGLHPQTGYTAIDRKLLVIRTRVRAAHVPETDIAPFMRLMTSLGSLAGRALAGKLFAGSDWPEKRFQSAMTDLLRADPRIGAELEEHPTVSGGTTDLSLVRVRLELKVESEKPIGVEDAENYSDQEAQYVVGSDRRLGVICVLDASEKTTAPGVPENDVGLLEVESPTGGVPLLLGVVILRGNLRRPSDYSP